MIHNNVARNKQRADLSTILMIKEKVINDMFYNPNSCFNCSDIYFISDILMISINMNLYLHRY